MSMQHPLEKNNSNNTVCLLRINFTKHIQKNDHLLFSTGEENNVNNSD